MKPHELFAVLIRIVGLISLLYLLGMGAILIGSGVPVFFVVRSILWLLLSIWLLRGAPAVVRFAYPNSQ